MTQSIYTFECKDGRYAREVISDFREAYSFKEFGLEIGAWMEQLGAYDDMSFLLTTFPGFIEEFDTNLLLDGEKSLFGIRGHTVAKAAALTFLMYYIGITVNCMKENVTDFYPDETMLDANLLAITAEVNFDKLRELLWECLVEVTGDVFYNRLSTWLELHETIYTPLFAALDKDPYFKRHKRLVTLFIRVNYMLSAFKFLLCPKEAEK